MEFLAYSLSLLGCAYLLVSYIETFALVFQQCFLRKW